MAQAPSVEDLLAIARSGFAGRLPAKVEEICALASRGAWQEVRVAAHKLRGSAATYGFPALSVLAAAIEDAVLDAGGAPDPSASARIGDALHDARAEADRAAGEGR